MQDAVIQRLQLRAVFASDLLENVPHMILDRVARDEQLLRDGSVGVVFQKQEKDLLRQQFLGLYTAWKDHRSILRRNAGAAQPR